MQYLAERPRRGGRILFGTRPIGHEGRELRAYARRDRHGLPGTDASLNPSMTIGAQLIECRCTMRAWNAARRRAAQMMLIGAHADGERIMRSYPHRFPAASSSASSSPCAAVESALLLLDEPPLRSTHRGGGIVD